MPDYSLPDDTVDDSEENPNTEHHANLKDEEDEAEIEADKGKDDAKT
jgi:hypothetical protein